MGHDSERVAVIYQHEAHGIGHLITSAIDADVWGAAQVRPESSLRGLMAPCRYPA
jgi:hypothetical protein